MTSKYMLLSGGLLLLLSHADASEPSVRAGFSPGGSAKAMVLGVIDSAQTEIRLAGYSFTSPEVAAALARNQYRAVTGNHNRDYAQNSPDLRQKETIKVIKKVFMEASGVDKFITIDCSRCRQRHQAKTRSSSHRQAVGRR